MSKFEDVKVSGAFAASSVKKASPLDIDVTGMNLGELIFAPQMVIDEKSGQPGLTTTKGPLITAMETGQYVRLQNLGKAQPGTDGGVLAFVEFIGGQRNEVTLHSPLGDQKLSLTRSDINPTFGMAVDVNTERANVSSASLIGRVRDGQFRKP